MKPPAVRNRLSPWLRFLAWCAFCILCLATLLVVTRWLVMNHGHQETLRLTRPLPIARTEGKKTVSTGPGMPAAAKETKQGLSLSALPYFGPALAGTEEEWQTFRKAIDEITDFFDQGHDSHNPAFGPNGVTSFRALVQNMGGEVPETMTEAEAAAEFLRQADRFSGLLARWREAIAKGPLASGQDDLSESGRQRFSGLSRTFSDLLSLTTAARLQAGDGDGAWSDWQTLKNSNDRLREIFPAGDGHYEYTMDSLMFNLAKSGVETGAWSNSHMTELSAVAASQNFLASALLRIEDRRERQKYYFENFRVHHERFREGVLTTPSQLDQVVNRVKLQLITDQQIRDNQALSLHRLNQELGRFDPETGYYVRPTEAEKQAIAETRSKPGFLGSYYFMIADFGSEGRDDDYTAKQVIRQQAEYNQLRLSVALDTYQRRTGTYPQNLEAVGSQLPGGAPRDIATGQPYFYQKEADGGYKLWSTGIDGKSDGGDDKNDITWKQPGRGN
jgi:hypothetical protein